MCIPYAPRDRDVAIRLTCALLGAWTDNRDNLADLCGSVHSSAARANLQLRESLVRDTSPTAYSPENPRTPLLTILWKSILPTPKSLLEPPPTSHHQVPSLILLLEET